MRAGPLKIEDRRGVGMEQQGELFPSDWSSSVLLELNLNNEQDQQARLVSKIEERRLKREQTAGGGHLPSDCQRISALTPEPKIGPEVKTKLGPLCKALASSRA